MGLTCWRCHERTASAAGLCAQCAEGLMGAGERKAVVSRAMSGADTCPACEGAGGDCGLCEGGRTLEAATSPAWDGWRTASTLQINCALHGPSRTCYVTREGRHIDAARCSCYGQPDAKCEIHARPIKAGGREDPWAA